MPVELTRNGELVTVDAYRYGCHNRAALRDTIEVQDGWTGDGRRKMVNIPAQNTKHCVYSRDNNDPACAGCKHKEDKP